MTSTTSAFAAVSRVGFGWEMTYTLGGPFGETAVESGTSVLVAGPPLTGKRRLCREVLRHGTANGEGAIVITARDTAERVRASFGDGNGADDRLGVVDCVSERVDGSQPDEELVRYASGPTDTTGVGIRFAEFVEYFQCERGMGRNRVMVDSITTLLQYSSLQTVFRFLHAVTGRVSEVDAVGVFVVESTVHDEAAMRTIRELFDGVVETSADGAPAVDLPDDRTETVRS